MLPRIGGQPWWDTIATPGAVLLWSEAVPRRSTPLGVEQVLEASACKNTLCLSSNPRNSRAIRLKLLGSPKQIGPCCTEQAPRPKGPKGPKATWGALPSRPGRRPAPPVGRQWAATHGKAIVFTVREQHGDNDSRRVIRGGWRQGGPAAHPAPPGPARPDHWITPNDSKSVRRAFGPWALCCDSRRVRTAAPPTRATATPLSYRVSPQ